MVEVGDHEPMGRPLAIEEGRTLLAELRDHVWLLNVLLIGTLARPSSILQMDWEQVDFEADLIFLNKAGRRQNKKRRPVVKMPPFLKAILLPLRGEGPVITFDGKRVKLVRTAWRQGRARAKLDETGDPLLGTAPRMSLEGAKRRHWAQGRGQFGDTLSPKENIHPLGLLWPF